MMVIRSVRSLWDSVSEQISGASQFRSAHPRMVTAVWRSERRSRMHPALLQKIYESAHLREAQAVAQGEDAQWRGRPLIGLEYSPKPPIGEKVRHLP